jgi:hypothetical protein
MPCEPDSQPLLFVIACVSGCTGPSPAAQAFILCGSATLGQPTPKGLPPPQAGAGSVVCPTTEIVQTYGQEGSKQGPIDTLQACPGGQPDGGDAGYSAETPNVAAPSCVFAEDGKVIGEASFQA